MRYQRGVLVCGYNPLHQKRIMSCVFFLLLYDASPVYMQHILCPCRFFILQSLQYSRCKSRGTQAPRSNTARVHRKHSSYVKGSEGRRAQASLCTTELHLAPDSRQSLKSIQLVDKRGHRRHDIHINSVPSVRGAITRVARAYAMMQATATLQVPLYQEQWGVSDGHQIIRRGGRERIESAQVK